MSTVELIVPVRHDDQRSRRLCPAAEKTQDIERRLIGPMEVLEDGDRRPPRRELLHERREHRVGLVAGFDDILESAARRRRDVEQRTEGSRRVEGIARAPENPRLVTALIAEMADERGLADAGLAGDQCETTATGDDVREALVELRDEGCSFEEGLPI